MESRPTTVKSMNIDDEFFKIQNYAYIYAA